MSATVLAQACADSDLSEGELEELSQALGEDGGATGGATGGGTTGGGTTGGGTTGGLPTFDSGATGGFGGLFGGLDGGIVFPPLPIDASFGDGGIIFPGDGGIVFPGDGGFIAGGDGGFIGGGPVPFANWKFDDCGPSDTLLDSSPSGAHAQRSAQVACAQGLVGGAVLIDARKDTISAPANAAFAVSDRVALAAWIHPTRVGQGTIVTKTLNGSMAFELVMNNGNLIFRINIDNGRRVRQVVTRAPIQANRWTHVAALYDGSFVRLLQDGAQVGQVAATGVIADVAGPIQIGNNQANDFVHGRIDEVWLSRSVVTVDDIASLACIAGTPTLTATPRSSGPHDPGASFTYDLAVTNNDLGGCQPRFAFADSFFLTPPGFSTSIFPGNLELASGTTGHFSLQVTSSTEAEPGTTQIPVEVFVDGENTFNLLETSVDYILNEPTGCFVRTGRELLIRDLSVVEDPIRTTFNGPPEDPRTGAWTFGRIMEQLAPSDAEAPDMVERMLNTWLSEQTINGFSVPPKPAMRTMVLDGWPRTENGKLDLKRAPLRLLSIVNRVDSRNLTQGHAGEGRFVFGVIGPRGFAEEFTVIFEFRLPAQTTADVLDWANRWHALGALPFPSEQYNAALQAITDRFSRRGAEPGRANGSALAQFRTNEIALTRSRWELREFELSATTHLLEPATVKLTPDTSFIQGSPLVASFINENESSVLREQHVVPELFNGQRFVGGSSFNDLIAWRAPGILNHEARHKFSLNTCNGCHSLQETNTAFLMVFPRELGEVSRLSPFMTGTVANDVETRAPRSLNDLGRRNTDLVQLVCPTPAPAPTARSASSSPSPSTSTTSREAFIAKGIDRTH